jgi:hypothetical protein
MAHNYLWEDINLSIEVLELKNGSGYKFLIQYCIGSDIYFIESTDKFVSDELAHRKSLNALSELTVNLKNKGHIDFCYH